MANLLELRDTIIKKKALAQAAQAEAEVAIKEMSKILESFTEDEINALANLNLDLRSILSVDLERLQSSEEYLARYKDQVETLADTVYERLEEELV